MWWAVCGRCWQDCGKTADEWASSICRALGAAASHYAPRGKNARHADIIQLLRITASNVDSVLNSAQELVTTGQLGSRQQENCTNSSAVKTTRSTTLWYASGLASRIIFWRPCGCYIFQQRGRNWPENWIQGHWTVGQP